MATDWLFYWITRPFGLLTIVIVMALPFFIWRKMLGSAFISIGFRPLAIAYAFSIIGLMALCFTSSYLEFNNRVSLNVFQEDQRWSIVPSWTIYIAFLSLALVLPLLGFVGVPVVAVLLKHNLFSYKSIALLILIAWLTLALGASLLTGDELDHANSLKALTASLIDIAPFTVVALPFLLSVYFTTRAHQGTES